MCVGVRDIPGVHSGAEERPHVARSAAVRMRRWRVTRASGFPRPFVQGLSRPNSTEIQGASRPNSLKFKEFPDLIPSKSRTFHAEFIQIQLLPRPNLLQFKDFPCPIHSNSRSFQAQFTHSQGLPRPNSLKFKDFHRAFEDPDTLKLTGPSTGHS